MRQLLSPHDIVRSGLCIGCGSCVASSNVPGTEMRFDSIGELKPAGPANWYRMPSEIFTRTCPFSPAAKNEDQLAEELFKESGQQDSALGKFQSAWVGHVSEEDFREQGSSGGMVTWVATELLRCGLIDGGLRATGGITNIRSPSFTQSTIRVPIFPSRLTVTS